MLLFLCCYSLKMKNCSHAIDRVNVFFLDYETMQLYIMAIHHYIADISLRDGSLKGENSACFAF